MAIPLIFLFRNPEVMWLSLRNACVLSLQLCLTLLTPQTVEETPLSMGFSRQEYWSGLPFPPPGDISDPGLETSSLPSPSLAGGFFTTTATWGAPNFQRCLLPSYSPRHKSCTKTSSSQAYFAMTTTLIFTPFNSPCTLLQVSHLKIMSKHRK